jgi:transposase
MDNASIHKKSEQKAFLENSGFELKFLPAYSPQLNPIEEVFSTWFHYIAPGNLNSFY